MGARPGLTRAIELGRQPFGIDFDAEGRLLITDLLSNTITVLDPIYDAVNEHAPTVFDDPESRFTSVTGVVGGAVIGTDADGDLLTYSVASEPDPTMGSVLVAPLTGAWQFTPTAQAQLAAWEAYSSDPNAESLSVTFVLAVTDGQTNDTVTISVDIVPGTQPVAQDPAFSIVETDQSTGIVHGVVHIIDADGDTLGYVLSSDFDWQAAYVSVDYSTGDWMFYPSQELRDTATTTPDSDEFSFVINVTGGGTTVPITVTVPVIATPDTPLQNYVTFEGDSLALYKYSGSKTIVLANSPALDAETMAKWLSALDGAYEFYVHATGREPDTSWAPTFIDGRATIARVTSTCGPICAYWGTTGIEIESSYFDYMYQRLLEHDEFDQAPFFEFSRNFWIYNKIDYLDAPYDPISGGFAVFMRSMSMEHLELKAAPFLGVSFSEFEDQVRSLREIYLADPSLNWTNTLAVSQGVPFAQNPILGPTDLFASFCF